MNTEPPNETGTQEFRNKLLRDKSCKDVAEEWSQPLKRFIAFQTGLIVAASILLVITNLIFVHSISGVRDDIQKISHRLDTSPSDVLKRVELLERALVVQPRDVLAELKVLRAEVLELAAGKGEPKEDEDL